MGGRTFTTGRSLTIRLLRQDRDGRGNLTLFLDRDTNPYNNNHARTLRRTNVRGAEEIVANRQGGATGGAEAGRYWVCARIIDANGHVRYAYSKRIELIDPPRRAAHHTREIELSTSDKSHDNSDTLDLLA
jgi:hypothetical protein